VRLIKSNAVAVLFQCQKATEKERVGRRERERKRGKELVREREGRRK
jgi:hypothetical protein